MDKYLGDINICGKKSAQQIIFLFLKVLYDNNILHHLSPTDLDHIRTLTPKINDFVNVMLKKYVDSRLFPHQKDHIQKCLGVIALTNRLVDDSEQGLGKSFVSTAIARLLNKNVILFCPDSSIVTWTKAKEHFGFNEKNFSIHKYTDFSKKIKPYLTPLPDTGSEDWRETRSGQSVTDFWIKNIKNYIVIFDECHHLKNDSIQSNCCVLLSQKAHENMGTIVMLSGTKYDKPEGAIKLMKMLNIVKHEEMTTYIPNKGHVFKGIHDIKKFCENLGVKTETFFQSNKKVGTTLGLYMCNKYISKILFRAMEPKKLEFDASVFFCDVSDDSRNTIRNGVNAIVNIMNTYGTPLYLQSAGQSCIIKHLMTIEYSKCEIFIRLAKKYLNENYKVIISVNYKVTLSKIAEELKDFNPLVLTGDFDPEIRRSRVSKFQYDKSGFDLLIAISSVIKEGMDLDNKNDKGKGRILLDSPRTSSITTEQVHHRILRCDTIGTPIVKVIFVKGITQELELLRKMETKASIIKESQSIKSIKMSDYKIVQE